MMKKVLITTLALFCLALTACSPQKRYDHDADADDVAERMVAAIGSRADYMSADDDHYEFYFGDNAAFLLVEDAEMVFSRLETDVNELGVFCVNFEQNVAAVRDMVQRYLDDQTANLRSFAANYSPEDMAKIDNAGIEVYGRYVVYYILDAEDEAAALDAVKRMITK